MIGAEAGRDGNNATKPRTLRFETAPSCQTTNKAGYKAPEVGESLGREGLFARVLRDHANALVLSNGLHEAAVTRFQALCTGAGLSRAWQFTIT